MNYNSKKEILDILNRENDNYVMLLEGFESCLIGYTYCNYGPARPIYDVDKYIKVLMKRDKMTEEQAWEHFDYNVLGSINEKDNKYPILSRSFKNKK